MGIFNKDECKNVLNAIEEIINENKMKKKLIEIPKELFKQIEDSSKKNDRSVNKEINHLLKSAVGKKNNCI